MSGDSGSWSICSSDCNTLLVECPASNCYSSEISWNIYYGYNQVAYGSGTSSSASVGPTCGAFSYRVVIIIISIIIYIAFIASTASTPAVTTSIIPSSFSSRAAKTANEQKGDGGHALLR